MERIISILCFMIATTVGTLLGLKQGYAIRSEEVYKTTIKFYVIELIIVVTLIIIYKIYKTWFS